MRLNSHGLAILRQEEGLVDGNPDTPALEPYLRPAGVWTWGYGHAITHPATGRQYRGEAARDAAMAEWSRRGWRTRAHAEQLLAEDADEFSRRVGNLFDEDDKITGNRLAALTCLAFDIGLKALADSTAVQLIHAGSVNKLAQVPDAIRRWSKATVKGRLVVMPDLVIRREIEARLFATPDDQPFNPLAIRRDMEARQ